MEIRVKLMNDVGLKIVGGYSCDKLPNVTLYTDQARISQCCQAKYAARLLPQVCFLLFRKLLEVWAKCAKRSLAGEALLKRQIMVERNWWIVFRAYFITRTDHSIIPCPFQLCGIGFQRRLRWTRKRMNWLCSPFCPNRDARFAKCLIEYSWRWTPLRLMCFAGMAGVLRDVSQFGIDEFYENWIWAKCWLCGCEWRRVAAEPRRSLAHLGWPSWRTASSVRTNGIVTMSSCGLSESVCGKSFTTSIK